MRIKHIRATLVVVQLAARMRERRRKHAIFGRFWLLLLLEPLHHGHPFSGFFELLLIQCSDVDPDLLGHHLGHLLGLLLHLLEHLVVDLPHFVRLLLHERMLRDGRLPPNDLGPSAGGSMCLELYSGPSRGLLGLLPAGDLILVLFGVVSEIKGFVDLDVLKDSSVHFILI